MGKEVVLLTQDLTDIPFDLKQYPHVGYGSNLGSLRRELQARIKMLLTRESETRVRTASSRRERASRGSAVQRPPSRKTKTQAQIDSVRNQLFISYSHRDIKWLKRLQIHLRPLERDNQVRRWDDTMLDPGDEWREKIREAVSIAKVAVLLISADFIASEFVHTDELPPLLASAESEGAEILPIIVSPSRFEQIKRLSRFQAVNPPSKPLINMTRTQQEQLFVNVTCRIEDVLARFTAG